MPVDPRTLSMRPATPDDQSLLERWDTFDHVRDASGEDDWGWEGELGESAWRTQWVALWEDYPVGFLQIMHVHGDPEDYWGPFGPCPHAQAIDIWLGPPEVLGLGIGSWMMRWAIARCFEDPETQRILIDPLESNRRAHTFYERHGFERIGTCEFGPDRCAIYELRRGAHLGQ